MFLIHYNLSSALYLIELDTKKYLRVRSLSMGKSSIEYHYLQSTMHYILHQIPIVDIYKNEFHPTIAAHSYTI